MRSTMRTWAPTGRLGLGLVLAALVSTGCGGVLDALEDGAESPQDPEATEDGPSATAGPEDGNGQDIGEPIEVRRLSDGDSGIIAIGGQEIEFRLLGYNAPERFEGDDGPLSCNGSAATDALEEALTEAGTGARFVGVETDRFGRTLGDFSVGGRSVVEGLVAGGHGLATGETGRRDLMEGAAAAGLGMWGPGCGAPAAEGIVVDRVEPDPPGRDEENLNGEFVELVNEGAEPVDLDGWDIRDDSSSHRFDLAGTIEPGGRLVIRTGAGSSGGGELFLDSRSPVWSNRGDTVLVIDPEGVIAAWAFVN